MVVSAFLESFVCFVSCGVFVFFCFASILCWLVSGFLAFFFSYFSLLVFMCLLMVEGCFFCEKAGILMFFEKKSAKCFAVKKKAIPLHSLYDSNGIQINAASLAQLARARDL